MSYGAPPPPPPPPYGAPTPPGGAAGSGGQSIPALISLILGVLGIVNSFCCSIIPLFPIAALALGLIGLNDVKKSHGAKTGRGLAVAGTILGGVGLLISIIWIIVAIVSGGYSWSFGETRPL